VVTITELRHGAERLAAGRRRRRLDEWLGKELTTRFAERILPVGLEVADACGKLVARSESLGRSMEPRAAFIAATAVVHGLALVTRNAVLFKATVKHLFESLDLAYATPCSSGRSPNSSPTAELR
jgi:predicted nucleic acid-binding protein